MSVLVIVLAVLMLLILAVSCFALVYCERDVETIFEKILLAIAALGGIIFVIMAITIIILQSEVLA
jgi:hypothetical protein